jgi:CheY-like chemotaxis protein
MPVIYVVHPNKEELSKIRHILAGRDFLLMEYENGDDAVNFLNKKPPDVCLMPMGITTSDDKPFVDTLHGIVSDCPVIILAGKNEVNQVVQMVGESFIYDYFLLNPVVDPVRLHIIIDKALTQSAVQLNLEDLKRRLSALPDDLPETFEEHANSLQRGVVKCLNNFKERMKSDEFSKVIELLDESAFEDKFADFQREEIKATIEKSKEKSKDSLAEKLTQFTERLQHQIDNPPDVNELQELRSKLNQGFYEFGEVNVDCDNNVDRISTRVAFKSAGTILFIDDEDNSTSNSAELIKNLGHRVLIAQSALKLVEMSRSNDIDLVICGYNLGRLNGIEVVRRIREDVGKTDLPVILLSSNTTQGIIEEAKGVGISEIISLPLRSKALEERISHHMK